MAISWRRFKFENCVAFLQSIVAKCSRKCADDSRNSHETYPMPEHGWTCYYCGETFTTVGVARDHFGATPAQEPGCLIDYRVQYERGGVPEHGRGLLIALRKAEENLERLRLANEQLDHEASLYHAQSSELERLFGTGVRTVHHAWLRYEAATNELEHWRAQDLKRELRQDYGL